MRKEFYEILVLAAVITLFIGLFNEINKVEKLTVENRLLKQPNTYTSFTSSDTVWLYTNVILNPNYEKVIYFEGKEALIYIETVNTDTSEYYLHLKLEKK
jgi:hypothetical protein